MGTNPNRQRRFLGYRPGIEVSADEPVTSADTEVTDGDGVTAAAPAEAQTTEEEDPNWLPTDQQKVFPDDVIAKYAKRYGYTEEQIRDNLGLRQLLHDKINSDIFLAKVRDGQQSDGEEPTLETDEATTASPQTPADPAEQRKQYYQQVDGIVERTCDPVALNELGVSMLNAFGVDTKSDDPEVKALVQERPYRGEGPGKGRGGPDVYDLAEVHRARFGGSVSGIFAHVRARGLLRGMG